MNIPGRASHSRKRLPQVILRQLTARLGFLEMSGTPQEFEKTCLITSVPQPSKSVSLRGWPATAALMGRGTRTDPTAALTTPPG